MNTSIKIDNSTTSTYITTHRLTSDYKNKKKGVQPSEAEQKAKAEAEKRKNEFKGQPQVIGSFEVDESAKDGFTIGSFSSHHIISPLHLCFSRLISLHRWCHPIDSSYVVN